MKVAVFKNIIEEKTPSMHLYANELLKNMPSNVEGFSMHAKSYPLLKYYITKEFVYPVMAGKHAADINHIADHSYAGLLRTLPAEKTVITCHDLIPLINSDAVSWIGKRRFWFNVKFLPKAKKIIVASEFTKQTIIKIFGKSLEGKIAIIPYGISEPFKPLENKDALREKYNIKKKSILHVGSFYPRKNIELILKLLVKRDDLQFIKIGPFSKYQLRFIRKHHLNNRIVHFNFIDSIQQVVEIYNSVGALVQPSLYEGFGLPILEAMASGCAVACSEISPFKEITNQAAVFFNPQDVDDLDFSINKILSDEIFKDNIVRKGLLCAQKYNWKECAQQTYKIYEDIHKNT